jgi:hypothetical protein
MSNKKGRGATSGADFTSGGWLFLCAQNLTKFLKRTLRTLTDQSQFQNFLRLRLFGYEGR